MRNLRSYRRGLSKNKLGRLRTQHDEYSRELKIQEKKQKLLKNGLKVNIMKVLYKKEVL
jgi:hypothetical protein